MIIALAIRLDGKWLGSRNVKNFIHA